MTRRLGSLGAAAVLAALFFWTAFTHQRIVNYPWPLMVNEGAMMASTDLLTHGRNPYDFEFRPQAANLYGILYPLAVTPLATLLRRNDLLIHRAVSAVFLLLCVAVIYALCLRAGIGSLAAAFVSVNIYAQQLYWGHPLARPDALGQFLFLASLYLALCGPRGYPALLLSGLLGCAAYYAKPYFLLAVPAVWLWLLWRRRFAEAWVYAAWTLLLGGLSVALVARIAPAYFYDTFFLQAIDSGYSFAFMCGQLPWLLSYQPGLAGALVLALALRFWEPRPDSRDQPEVVAEVRRGLWFFSLLGFLAFVFLLGGNKLNIGTYLLDLVLPFLLPALATRLTGNWPSVVAGGLVAVNVAFALQWVPVPGAAIRKMVEEPWQVASRLIDGQKSVLASQDFTPLLLEKGRPYADGGHGRFYDGVMFRHKAELLAPLFPRRGEAQARYDAFEQGIRKDLFEKKYSMVLECPEDKSIWRDALKKNYAVTGRMSLAFFDTGFRPIEIWLPIDLKSGRPAK